MGSLWAWFPLDHDGIVKLWDPSKFWLTAQRFVWIYDKIVINFSRRSPLRSLRSLRPLCSDFHMIAVIVAIATIAALVFSINPIKPGGGGAQGTG